MSLSISASKMFLMAFMPWILALIVLLLIETGIKLVFHPHEFDRTNFLQFSFAQDETPQRAFIYHKVREFADSNYTIVQSGDSSGFFGIKPEQIMEYLPDGITYLNMSCCANLGYRGYYNLLWLMAERNPSVKYIVLYISPTIMPRAEFWDTDGAALWQDPSLKVFGGDIYREFLSGWRIFQLPSLAFRREVTNKVYKLSGKFGSTDRPISNNPRYEQFLQMYRDTFGWMPENDPRVQVPASECQMQAHQFFDISSLSWKTYIEEVLDEFASLARRMGVTLIVAFQPVACTFGTGKGSLEAHKALEQFKINNPDVEIPFKLIETWPSHYFSVPAHIKNEYIHLIGERLGKAMAEILQHDQMEKPAQYSK